MALDTRPDQYALGKGRFYFAPSTAPTEFRFIGNVPSFALTPSSDTLEHTSSMSGINVKDRDIVISQSLDISFTTDNISRENVALWIGGSVDVITQTSGTGLTQSIASVKKGIVYFIGVTTANPAGVKDITVTSVMQGATTLVAGVDYVVNSRAGSISFPTTGAATAGTAATVTYSIPASTRDQVNSRNRTITGTVRFVSDNPDTGSGKLDYEYLLPTVRLAADGDYNLIGDDWLTLGFTGSVLQNYDAVGNEIPQMTSTPLTVPT